MPELRILVVDDSAATRQMLTSAVEELAAERGREARVDTADSGLTALRALPSGPYDLILTDINMPEVHGLELIRFVRQHPLQKDAPILVVSTQAAERDRQKALSLGATGYVTKPVTLAALREALTPLWPAAAPGGAP
ncbi:MAG: response regulator [Deltaproteobacteria bacterium]|nr:response regulator [Deltaproteobacteria bacterium]